MGCKFGEALKLFGIPILQMGRDSKFEIGSGVSLVSEPMFNLIGRSQKCSFHIGDDAHLCIGDNTGISFTSIVCQRSVKIGKNVIIGGNTAIYDTDFHSLDYINRRSRIMDIQNSFCKEIIIGDDVFIGAGTTILKGVHIGERSIIAAGSVVTKSIPPDEVWGGNPVRYIRSLQNFNLS